MSDRCEALDPNLDGVLQRCVLREGQRPASRRRRPLVLRRRGGVLTLPNLQPLEVNAVAGIEVGLIPLKYFRSAVIADTAYYAVS
jgi:hypothetical protein